MSLIEGVVAAPLFFPSIILQGEFLEVVLGGSLHLAYSIIPQLHLIFEQLVLYVMLAGNISK